MIDTEKYGILLPMRNKSRLVVFMVFAILTGYLAISDSLFLRDCATASAWVSPESIYNRTRPGWSGVEKRVEYEFNVDGKTYTGSGFIKVPLQNNAFPIHYIPSNPSISRTDFPSPIFWAIGFLLSCIGVVLVWQPKWCSEIVRFMTSPPSRQIDNTL